MQDVKKSLKIQKFGILLLAVFTLLMNTIAISSAKTGTLTLNKNDARYVATQVKDSHQITIKLSTNDSCDIMVVDGENFGVWESEQTMSENNWLLFQSIEGADTMSFSKEIEQGLDIYLIVETGNINGVEIEYEITVRWWSTQIVMTLVGIAIISIVGFLAWRYFHAQRRPDEQELDILVEETRPTEE